MAKKIRFPLQMNGVEVRTIEELRENFDLESVLGYFTNGKLVTWLKDRYYDDEAMAVEALSADDTDLNQKLMSILDVAADTEIEEIDMEVIQRRNEKLLLLRQITDDKNIIDKVDCVAFNQDDLLDILDEGVKEIYLCQGDFEIPLRAKNITYYGLENPSVSLRKNKTASISSSNIKFVGITIPDDLNNSCANNDSSTKDVEYYKTKANEGDAESQYQLGCLYEKGDGVSKDINEAIEWYNESAYNGNVDAMYKLGQLYEPKNSATPVSSPVSSFASSILNIMNGINSGQLVKSAISSEQLPESEQESENCVTSNLNLALKWYDKAAENGNVMAQIIMGQYYYSGEGVEKNYEKAVNLYRNAAEQGYAIAQNNLGECYAKGNGIEQDWEKAMEWYRKAAEQGYAVAQYNLGDCYQAEGSGIAESAGGDYDDLTAQDSFRKAVKWFRKAVEQENKDAQFSLGWCYQYGQGVPVNLQKAIDLYQKSAKQGHKRSKECLKELGKTW